MDRYCIRYGLEDEEYDEFIDIMEGLDQAFLDQLPKPAKPGGKKGGR